MQCLNSMDSMHECILKRMIKRIKKKSTPYCISKKSKWNNMVVNGKRFHTKPSILINAQGSVIWLIPSESSFREQVSCNWGQRNRLWQCQECISESLILQWTLSPSLKDVLKNFQFQMLTFKNGQPWSILSLKWQPPQPALGTYESFMIILCHEYTFTADLIKCKWETPRGQQVISHDDKFGGIVLLNLHFILLKILYIINCLLMFFTLFAFPHITYLWVEIWVLLE